ncbi:hypothetical protein M0804_002031 [Polistes exclamans]|nr:hypothetical protein M0804_002031 [Polistes exclamans]
MIAAVEAEAAAVAVAAAGVRSVVTGTTTTARQSFPLGLRCGFTKRNETKSIMDNGSCTNHCEIKAVKETNCKDRDKGLLSWVIKGGKEKRSDIKKGVAILNCLYARQLCFEDPSCSAILEIIPRVCGPELGEY